MRPFSTIPLLLALMFSTKVFSQELASVAGKVTDSETHEAIAYASVTAGDGHYATVSNADGEFILRLPSDSKGFTVSHIGYATRKLKLTGDRNHIAVRLQRTTIMLDNILAARPEDVVRIAIKSIADNYVSVSVIQRCFYRETTQKGKRFIYVAESINDMYRTPYSQGITGDRVAIVKARRLVSASPKDTLGAKLIGGPTTPLTLDAVKNLDFLLNEDNLQYYDFSMLPASTSDGLGQVKVSIRPKKGASIACPYALLYGDIYILTNTIGITHIDMSLDLSNKTKATNAMLYHKPLGVKFKPKGMTLYLTYKPSTTGRLTLSYLRVETSFTCEWKRKLFAAPYRVTSEMVVTDEHTDGVKAIKSRDSFKERESLFDHPEYFGDPEFWKDYNIIAPTESLENGIKKLKRKIINNE